MKNTITIIAISLLAGVVATAILLAYSKNKFDEANEISIKNNQNKIEEYKEPQKTMEQIIEENKDRI